MAHRAGYGISIEKAEEFSRYIISKPEQLDASLKRLNIYRSYEHELSSQEEEWKALYPKVAQSHQGKNYFYLFTKKDKSYIAKLNYYMEKIFKIYQKKFKMKEKIAGKFIIKLFPSQLDFQTHTQSEAFAFFRASDRSLVGYRRDDESPGEQKEFDLRLTKTFFHEGFHQFLNYYVPSPPTWLNEGLAENFEAIEIKGRKIHERGNLHYNNLYWLKKYIKAGQTTPLKTLIYMDQATLYENSRLHYPMSWGLIHFFAHGSSRYKKYYQDVISNLKEGKTLKETLDLVFQNIDWDALEKAYATYILKLKASRPSDRF